ncbi:MAG: tRNA (N(6)-L-threonylcarbamoyladenosine(37)-C(2))-methylthiotransferase MtaB [Bacteroidaceae bacterium]|nr:tRNA (N(6)-L-threonylcarbamoyladenosine(37)-C(2))-methylthiotransferase MtaB [Bacteroidaceae bacterium]
MQGSQTNEASWKAAYFTLGCKLNFAETSTVGQQLKAAGIRMAQKGEVADVCIVNTCSVTEVADHKCRQAIHKLVRQHPGALVVVTGCYAQLQPQQVSAIEGVDLVLGAEEKGQVVERVLSLLAARKATAEADEVTADLAVSPCHDAHQYFTHRTSEIRSFMPSCSCGNRTRYFLKVQDGCDYYCTYCTIPIARGRSRNGSIEMLVGQAREVAARGAKEIVITGVNIGDFGKTTGEDFLSLVKALDAVEGIERYRISSIEPNLLTDEIIEYCAQSRAFMPHFHIPLQSGCDEVLRLMHRRYDTALFRHKVERIKALMPDAFIGVDVIVGTRGETEEYFRQAEQFLQSLDVTQLHVFSYSERPGTKALNIPHVVTPQEKRERSNRLLTLSDEKLHTYYNKYTGAVRPVLLEHSRTKGIMHGFTDNYIKVELHVDPSEVKLLDNTIVQVRLGSWNEKGDALMAERI